MIAVCHLKLVEGRSAMIDLQTFGSKNPQKKVLMFLEVLALVCVELSDLGIQIAEVLRLLTLSYL